MALALEREECRIHVLVSHMALAIEFFTLHSSLFTFPFSLFPFHLKK